MPIPAGERVRNDKLRAARLAMCLSLDEFARTVREAGETLGEPNGCTKRLVQRWESGEHVQPRSYYARALEHATGLSCTQLGLLPLGLLPGKQELRDAVQRAYGEGRMREGMAAAGQTAALAGWLALDRADPASAQKYFVAAASAAASLVET